MTARAGALSSLLAAALLACSSGEGPSAPSDSGADAGGDAVPEGPDAGPPPVTFARLVAEATDLAELSRWPDPPYDARMASSFDRASKRPDLPGWFSNVDFGHYRLTLERGGHTEHVLHTADGPGVVTRIWSANPSGTLRVYIDGDTPAIEADMASLLSGAVLPLGAQQARGYSLHYPIAYRRSCRITVESAVAAALFYQVNHREYPRGTEVEPFDPRKASGPEIAEARARLEARAPAIEGEPRRDKLALSSRRASVRIAAPPGGAALTELTVRPSRADRDALEGTRLVLTFDGVTTVQAPLGRFFGTGAELHPFRTLTLAADESGALHARFVMPFARTAEVGLERDDDLALEADVVSTVAPRPWDARSLLFFATATQSGVLPARPVRDRTLLDRNGRGRIVGLSLDVDARMDGWWGEGDEKIWIDGDAFPRVFGTGTEDLFGFGFCSREPFATAYAAQITAPPVDDSVCAGGFAGRTALHRSFVLDAIPFARSARFDLELWSFGEIGEIAQNAIVYGYAAP